jgi:hypothetical protein
MNGNSSAENPIELLSNLKQLHKLFPSQINHELLAVIDSTLEEQLVLNFQLKAYEFEELKNAIRLGQMDVRMAKRIFPNLTDDSVFLSTLKANNYVAIGFHSFDSDQSDFTHFAISIGGNELRQHEVYFFHSSTILAKHRIFHHSGLNFQHYIDQQNNTVVYYSVNLGSGTGYFWNQWNFYRYDQNGFKPLLSEISSYYCQFPSKRVCSIEGKVANTKPLKIHYVMSNNLVSEDDLEFPFLNDSAIVEFKMDVSDQKLYPSNSDRTVYSNIHVPYYSDQHELAFIQANYKRMKEMFILPNALNQLLISYYLKHAGVMK